jgi:hypothetical protein
MFCDNCKCLDCQHGTKYLSHAQTSNNDWICDVCYTYDLCTSGPNRNPNGPCDEKNCSHRPTLISDWIPYHDSI